MKSKFKQEWSYLSSFSTYTPSFLNLSLCLFHSFTPYLLISTIQNSTNSSMDSYDRFPEFWSQFSVVFFFFCRALSRLHKFLETLLKYAPKCIAVRDYWDWNIEVKVKSLPSEQLLHFSSFSKMTHAILFILPTGLISSTWKWAVGRYSNYV